MVQTLFEKLNFKEEKNILVQGLPLHIERNFIKLTYTKNVTPLLRKNKIDFALLFSIDRAQLERILPEVLDCLSEQGKLWIVYPKRGSKIFSDLNANESWQYLREKGFHLVRTINIDHVYNAVLYVRNKLNTFLVENYHAYDYEVEEEDIPEDVMHLFDEFSEAAYYFTTLSFPYQRQFLYWIESATELDMRRNRMKQMIEKLVSGNYVIS